MIRTWQRLWAYTDSHLYMYKHTSHTHAHTLRIRRSVQLQLLLHFWNILCYNYYSVHNSQCLQLEILCLTCVSITFLVRCGTPDLVCMYSVAGMYCNKWWRTMFPQSVMMVLIIACYNLNQVDTFTCTHVIIDTHSTYTHTTLKPKLDGLQCFQDILVGVCILSAFVNSLSFTFLPARV